MISQLSRGDEYVHCLMHRCIMGIVGGNEIHVKYVKTRKFYNIRGEICKSRGERELSNFPK